MKLRPSVRRFAELMERELRANDHKGGWSDDAPNALLARLIEETGEMARAMVIGGDVAKEAADVANFAMMLSENCSSQEAAK